jgi:hypothetical protein
MTCGILTRRSGNMDIQVPEDRLYELSCKLYALADLFMGLAVAEDIGFHEHTPYGLCLLIGDMAEELERLSGGDAPGKQVSTAPVGEADFMQT